MYFISNMVLLQLFPLFVLCFQSESASSGDEMSMYHNRDARVVTQRGPLLSGTTYTISLRK